MIKYLENLALSRNYPVIRVPSMYALKFIRSELPLMFLIFRILLDSLIFQSNIFNVIAKV